MIWPEPLRMGVDMATETDPETVEHVRTAGYVPSYRVEEWDGFRWGSGRRVAMADLPDVVERMHWAYDRPIRLLEDGFPVFTCAQC